MLQPSSSTEHGSLWWLEHASTGQLSESHIQIYGHKRFFFFFTILFITISVLFSCKGIQQKLLKRSCPQNGAARLPFLGVPHFLLIPRGGEPGEGGAVYQRKSPALGATVGALEKGRACLGGMLSAAISEVPLEWGLGHGMASPQEELKNSILPFLPRPEPNLPDKGSKGLTLLRIPESALRGPAGWWGGERGEP